MPEEIEVETSELQEAIDKLHKERAEREKVEKSTGWTKYIGLTTAILAVFAAIGALRSGSLVNEAMIEQLKASDKWNEYQAARQKSHIYLLQTNAIIDRALAYPSDVVPTKKGRWSPKTAAARAKEYEGQVEKEESKGKDLSEEAKKLEKEAAHEMDGHHIFANSVAYIQVAIALGAISALTKLRLVWIMSIVVGAIGLYLCIAGLLAQGF
jgi:hypothetical protein